jgi:hypothetical protein
MKDKSLSVLIKEADQVFSELVRRQDAHNGYELDGYIRCLCCPRVVHWKEADAAHCFDRDNMGTRYHELNVWPTCRYCNRFDPEHRSKIREAVKKLIGECEFEYLEELSHSTLKFTRSDLLELIQEYKTKLKQLKS